MNVTQSYEHRIPWCLWTQKSPLPCLLNGRKAKFKYDFSNLHQSSIDSHPCGLYALYRFQNSIKKKFERLCIKKTIIRVSLTERRNFSTRATLIEEESNASPILRTMSQINKNLSKIARVVLRIVFASTVFFGVYPWENPHLLFVILLRTSQPA